jgi:hypothetical protein
VRGEKEKDPMNPIERLRHISPEEFALLGMQGLAYIKRVTVNDVVAYGIYSADGTQVALVPSREVAVGTVMQHELEPLSVH